MTDGSARHATPDSDPSIHRQLVHHPPPPIIITIIPRLIISRLLQILSPERWTDAPQAKPTARPHPTLKYPSLPAPIPFPTSFQPVFCSSLCLAAPVLATPPSRLLLSSKFFPLHYNLHQSTCPPLFELSLPLLLLLVPTSFCGPEV